MAVNVSVQDGRKVRKYRVNGKTAVGEIAEAHAAKMKGVPASAIVLEYNGRVLHVHETVARWNGATLTRRRIAGNMVFRTDVVSMILAFSPRGAVVAMTNRMTYQQWKRIAGERLEACVEGTGLSLDTRPSVFRGINNSTLLGILMGGSTREVRENLNSCEGLGFVLELKIGKKAHSRRLLDEPSSIDFYPGYSDAAGLQVTFYLKDPIPTKRLPTRQSDVRTGLERFHGSGQLFSKDDVADDDLFILNVKVFDKKTNYVAEAYHGVEEEKIVPNGHGDYTGQRWEEYHTNCGWAFESSDERFHPWPGGYADGDKYDTRAAFYFDAEEVLPYDVLEDSLIPGDWPEIPIGTNFTTVQLFFQNVDNIAHLKTILSWRPLI